MRQRCLTISLNGSMSVIFTHRFSWLWQFESYWNAWTESFLLLWHSLAYHQLLWFKSQTIRTSECFKLESRVGNLWHTMWVVLQGHLSANFNWNQQKKNVQIHLGEYKKHMLHLIVLSKRTNDITKNKTRIETSLDPWDVVTQRKNWYSSLNF